MKTKKKIFEVLWVHLTQKTAPTRKSIPKKVIIWTLIWGKIKSQQSKTVWGRRIIPSERNSQKCLRVKRKNTAVSIVVVSEWRDCEWCLILLRHVYIPNHNTMSMLYFYIKSVANGNFFGQVLQIDFFVVYRY